MRASIVESIHELRAMRAEWDALIGRAANGDLFGTFDWLETWWLHFSEPEQMPAIFIVRDGGKLVAGLPLMRAPIQGFRGLRSIFNHYSGRSDLYFDPQYPKAVGLLLSGLRACSETWDVVELDWIPADSPLYLQLAHAELDGMAVHGTNSARSPFLQLRGRDFGEYYREQFSAKTRSRDRSSLREVSERPGYRLEIVRDRDAVRPAIEAAMRIETLGWKGNEGSSMEQDPRVRGFVLEITERLAFSRKLALTMLHAGGEPAAFVLGFVHADTYYYYKTSFDPKYQDLRPGRIVTNHAIEDAFTRKLARFDFLGASDDYKLRYTSAFRVHATIFLHHSGVRSRLHRALKRTAAPLAKSLLNKGGAWPVLIDRPGRALG